MIAVLQRVKKASVSVEQKVVGSCRAGLLILLGVASGKTVDVSNLTDSQINTIHQLIAEFNKANT